MVFRHMALLLLVKYAKLQSKLRIIILPILIKQEHLDKDNWKKVLL